MIDHVLFVYDFNLRHARHLVEGVTPEQAVAQPCGLVNHIAWAVGHLAVTSNVVMMELGGEMAFPQEWAERFFPGVPITSDVDAYPELGARVYSWNSSVGAVRPPADAFVGGTAARPQMELVQRRFDQSASSPPTR